jgi:hypothetical protein
MKIKNYLLTAILALAALTTISCSPDDDQTAIVDDVFIGVGKWKIKKSLNSSSNKSIACDLNEIIFRSDNSFKIVTDKAILTGKYSFDGATTISLTKSSSPTGSITNLLVVGGDISFSIELSSGCTQEAEGEKDETYDETEDINSGTSSSTLTDTESTTSTSTIDTGTTTTTTDTSTSTTDIESNTSTSTTNTVINTTGVIVGQGVYTVATNITINLSAGETNTPKPEGYDLDWLGIEKIGEGTGKIFIIRPDGSRWVYDEYTNRGIDDGASVFLTAIADEGYNFVGWYRNGNIWDPNSHRIFELDGEDLLLQAKFVRNNYTQHPLYSKLDHFSTPLDYVKVFMEDASSYGWDFESTVKRISIENNTGAYSLYSCGGVDAIHINLNQNGGGDSWSTWDFAHKMMIIYHELGHDLLSLTHICVPGQHMTGWDSCDGDTSPLLHNGREINQQDIKYNSDDPVTDWNRATKDMFELNKQEYLYCD